MTSLFSHIVQGDIPCDKILENDQYLAFLEIRPINPGHALVIPKKEVDYIFDLQDDELAGLMVFAKKVAKMIKKAVPCRKVAIVVYGMEVPHAHVHLVPIHGKPGELSFANQKSAALEELKLLAEKIRQQ